MRITFIRPSITGTRAFDAMEPLAFAILKGLTPPEVEVEFFDERLEAIPENLVTDLVALTVETYTARRAYQISSTFRRRGVPVVMGGYHPSFLPEEALQFADAVVLGDAENQWAQVLHDVQHGQLQRIYQQAQQPSLEGLKFDRSIFQGKRYSIAAPVQYGRGCKYACDFCSIHAFYGFRLRQRPIAEVVAEIAALQRRFILLVDDNLFVDVEQAEALFRALIPLRIKWGCQVSIDIAHNEKLLALMQQSGCHAALIGFESLNDESLAEMKKKWNLRYGDYASLIRRFHQHGIMVYGSFVFGYDHDTPEIFARTTEFAIESKLFLVNFSALTPTPGSALYDRLRKEGRLLFEQWWIDPRYRYGQATFQPQRMSAEELTQGCLEARRKFYSHASILRRFLAFDANSRSLARMLIYLSANLISRKELQRKLGQQLGTDAPLLPVEAL